MSETAHSLGSLDSLRAAGSQLVELEQKMIAVFCLGERVLAVEERCSHRAGPLSEGKVVDGRVVCPWHGSEFEISTGDVKRPRQTVPQDPYGGNPPGRGVYKGKPRGTYLIFYLCQKASCGL